MKYVDADANWLSERNSMTRITQKGEQLYFPCSPSIRGKQKREY